MISDAEERGVITPGKVSHFFATNIKELGIFDQY